MVREASVCRLSALNRHPDRSRNPERPVSPAQRRCVAERQNLIFARLAVCAAISYGFDHYDIMPRHHLAVVKALLCQKSALRQTVRFSVTLPLRQQPRATNCAPHELNVRVRTAGTSSFKRLKADPLPYEGRGRAQSAVRADAPIPSRRPMSRRRCESRTCLPRRNGNDTCRGRPQVNCIPTTHMFRYCRCRTNVISYHQLASLRRHMHRTLARTRRPAQTNTDTRHGTQNARRHAHAT